MPLSLLDTADANLTRRNARDLWRAGNEAGDGFAPDVAVTGEQPGINELSAEFGTLVLRADTNMDVAVYNDDDRLVLVGDSHGPWCVRVSR